MLKGRPRKLSGTMRDIQLQDLTRVDSALEEKEKIL
jgi:hypothetical protein